MTISSVNENDRNILRVLDPEGGHITDLPVTVASFDDDIRMAEQICKAYVDNWQKVKKEKARIKGEHETIASLLEKRNS